MQDGKIRSLAQEESARKDSIRGDVLKQNNSLRSLDEHPWDHPFLTSGNIKRFRAYSESVWEFAFNYQKRHRKPLKCAFAVNMAQNMYQWARIANKLGAEVALFPNMMDETALNAPEWDEFDGEYPDVMDGKGFLEDHSNISLMVPCEQIPFDGSELYMCFQEFCKNNKTPLLRLMADSPGLRHEILLNYPGFYPYFKWAKRLSQFDVVYIAGTPFAAYASGKPYAAFATGGDLQYDCGRPDVLGQAMSLSFNAATFLMISNPHALGHSRRIGLTKGVYLPYPVEDSRYCLGEGLSRKEWETRYGPGIYVFSSSRLDPKVKGQDEAFFGALAEVARKRKEFHFIFLTWGESAETLKLKAEALGMGRQFIFLSPVGKKCLIDYYRSCDIVLDHFVFGYYGATALEAAAIGKPIIMRFRSEQYRPLYQGDIAPVFNVNTPREVTEKLILLADHTNLRKQKEIEMREWLIRTHGEAKTGPLMMSLLQIVADQVPLPKDLINPLLDPETEEEKEYHERCLQPMSKV